MQHDVDTLIETLSRTGSARHVRCLSIKGFLRLDVERSGDSGNEVSTLEDYDGLLALFKSTGIDEILVDAEPVIGGSYVYDHDPVIERSSEEDMAWAPVVGLIETLSYLTTLVYNCRNQFPPSLLDVLHERHLQCKLHHLTFQLRSLLSDTPDPYEMALATSPCLYGVKVRCALRDSNGDDNFNQEAVRELAAGLAPSLKEVAVVNLQPFIWNFDQPRGPWKGLPGFVPGGGIGSLTSLSLTGWLGWSPDLFQTWAKHTDFGHLRHLTLGAEYGDSFAPGIRDEMLEWLVQNCSFPRLKVLRIRLRRDNLFAARPSYADNAVALFRALEPLDELSVYGPLEPKILDAILSRHGPTLQKLNLRPSENEREEEEYTGAYLGNYKPMVFGKEHILQIQTQCPALQELAIPVKRTTSNTVEAEIYKSFGKMECLQSLFLTLDCSEWRLTDDASYKQGFADEEESKLSLKLSDLEFLREDHLRDIFINCAVDETLARSIWEIICQHKVGKQLESLKLWTRGGGSFGNFDHSYEIDKVVGNLSRSWLIERVVGDVLNVRELGRGAREMRDQELTDRYKSKAGLDRTGFYSEPEIVFGVLHRIWARKEGSRDWREDWSSLPLQV